MSRRRCVADPAPAGAAVAGAAVAGAAVAAAAVAAAAVAAACAGVSKSYAAASGRAVALADLDLTVPGGRVTGIVGPSGSGKSSLLRLLAAVDRPDAGSVLVGGEEVSRLRVLARRRLRARLVSYVFQRPTDNLFAELTVRQHLDLAARLRGTRVGEADLAGLELLGLAGRADHRPEQLSGGEQQRVAFAAAVVGAPALVVADEPTAELDSVSAAALVEALHDLCRRGTSVVVASHDPIVIGASDQVVRLDRGRRV